MENQCPPNERTDKKYLRKYVGLEKSSLFGNFGLSPDPFFTKKNYQNYQLFKVILPLTFVLVPSA